MSDPVQQIKDRLNIVDVIGQYVKLAKAGRNYKGLSPFKKEKTPSFFVSPEKGMYYDFSSGQGGDIFTFVQEMEGLDFKGALKVLADRAGIEVRRESKQLRDARDRQYDALDEALAFYETQLTEQPDALTYLHERGLQDATIRSFRLGWAPDSWRALADHLEAKGFRLAELETAGLVKRGDRGSHYDRFRSRIMFPIMDTAGRVVAFTGRIFGTAAADDKNAKYLNSPETPLFDKGKTLHGYDKAKHAIRKYGFAILVEGQMDLVLSHQAGYTNTVAVSGTGLTNDHLTLIQRLSKNLVLAFDADEAGVSSTGRAASLALGRGMDVKVATVPLGKDPADCIHEDPEAWKKAVGSATHVVEFLFEHIQKEAAREGYDERKTLLLIRDHVLPFIGRITSGVDQGHFVRLVADRTSLSEEAVWQDVRAAARTYAQETRHPGAPVPTASQPRRERTVNRAELTERTLAGFLFWQETLEPRVLEETALAQRASELHVPLEPLLARFSEERDTLAFQAECSYDTAVDPHDVLETLLVAIAREQLLQQRTHLSLKIREAERAHDDAKAHDLLTRFCELSNTLERLEQSH